MKYIIIIIVLVIIPRPLKYVNKKIKAKHSQLAYKLDNNPSLMFYKTDTAT